MGSYFYIYNNLPLRFRKKDTIAVPISENVALNYIAAFPVTDVLMVNRYNDLFISD